MLKEICDAAHVRGVKVSAHVTQAHNLEVLVRAGIDDAGHMVYDHLSDELILMKYITRLNGYLKKEVSLRILCIRKVPSCLKYILLL